MGKKSVSKANKQDGEAVVRCNFYNSIGKNTYNCD